MLREAIRGMKQISIFLLVSIMLLQAPLAVANDSASTMPTIHRMPAYLLEIPEAVKSILIAETETATMHRFASDDGGVLEVDQRYMSIGLNGPGKEKAWDKRTPLGIYFITESLDTSKLHAKYGAAAFPLDYPNAWDRFNQRTGYGIWLHGVDPDNPNRPARDTDGCLALPNEEIVKLAVELKPLLTPVIVAREIDWVAPSNIKELRQEFRGMLDMWRESMERGDIAKYLSLYSADSHHFGMGREEWLSSTRESFDNKRFESIKLEDVMLVAHPEEPDLYLSRFTQVLASVEGLRKITTKRLYWHRSNAKQWKILIEDAG